MPAGTSLIVTATQQVAYTFTATEACVARSIKLDTGITTASLAANYNVPYVLVRVQEGYNANTITYPAITGDMYNPTNEVLISGVLTDNTVEDHKSNMIGRKMKAGDRLALIFFNNSGIDVTVSFEMPFTVLT